MTRSREYRQRNDDFDQQPPYRGRAPSNGDHRRDTTIGRRNDLFGTENLIVHHNNEGTIRTTITRHSVRVIQERGTIRGHYLIIKEWQGRKHHMVVRIGSGCHHHDNVPLGQCPVMEHNHYSKRSSRPIEKSFYLSITCFSTR